MNSAGIVEKIFSKPVEHLLLSRKKLPNIEVIRLYREAYKFAGKFYWNNEKGEPWTEALRRSMRKQFQLIMKMMVTTRECMKEMDMKLCKAQTELVKNIDETRTQSGQQYAQISKNHS